MLFHPPNNKGNDNVKFYLDGGALCFHPFHATLAIDKMFKNCAITSSEIMNAEQKLAVDLKAITRGFAALTNDPISRIILCIRSSKNE